MTLEEAQAKARALSKRPRKARKPRSQEDRARAQAAILRLAEGQERPPARGVARPEGEFSRDREGISRSEIEEAGAPEESWGDFGAQLAGDVVLGTPAAALTLAVTSPLGPWVSIPAAGAVGAVTGGIGGRVIDNLIGEDEAATPLDPSEMAFDALFGGGLGLAGKAVGAGVRRYRHGRGESGSAFVRWLEDQPQPAVSGEDLDIRDPYQSLERNFTQTPQQREGRLRALMQGPLGQTATVKEIIAGRGRAVAQKKLRRDEYARKWLSDRSEAEWLSSPNELREHARKMGLLSPDEKTRYEGFVDRGGVLQEKFAKLAREETGKRQLLTDREELPNSGWDFVKTAAQMVQSRMFKFKRPNAMFRGQDATDTDKLISKVLEAVGVDSVAVEQTYQALINQIGTHGSKGFQDRFYDYAIGDLSVGPLTEVDYKLLTRYWKLQTEIFQQADLENILVLHEGKGMDALHKAMGKGDSFLEPMMPKWEKGKVGRYAAQYVDPKKAKGMEDELAKKFPGSMQHDVSRGFAHMFGRVNPIPDEYLIKDFKRLLSRQKIQHAHTLAQGLNLGGHVSDSLGQITMRGQHAYVHGWLKAFFEHTQRKGDLGQSNMLREVMSDFYDAEQDTEMRGTMAVLKDMASRVYLPRNAIPQLTEAMNVFGFSRISDLTQGRKYHKRFGLKEQWARSMGSVQDQIAEGLSSHEKHQVTAMMARKADRGARRFAIEPLTGKLLRMAREAGDNPTAAQLWEASEAFSLEVSDMDAWRKLRKIGDGSTEEQQELLREGVDNLIRRQMHLFTTTTRPPIMGNPASSMVLQFRNFSLNAAGRFYEDIIGPIRHGKQMANIGRQTGNKEMRDQGRDLAMLGVKRFGRATMMGFAPQTAGRALRTVLDKNTEGWEAEDWIWYLAAYGAKDTAGMQMGVYADMASVFVNALAGDTREMDTFVGRIPAVGVAWDTAGRGVVGTGQIARGLWNDRPENVQSGLNQVLKGGLNMARVLAPHSVTAALLPSPTSGTVRALQDAILDD